MSDVRHRDRPRGLTLIELMVVVAIIGVLAAIGGVAYMNQMRKGKITKLKQLALEVKKGQKQYASRNAQYFHPGTNPYNPNKPGNWGTLLEFNHTDDLPPDIDVRTIAGGPGCSSCASSCNFCPSSMDPSGGGQNWYAIRVRQDLKPGGDQTTVIGTSSREDLVVLHSGE